MKGLHQAAKKKLGFTNCLAIILVIFLAVGLAGGYKLAVMSIYSGYSGGLLCWTVVFTPIGTAIGLVLGKVVDKSRAENTKGGIVYDTAMNSERDC